MLVAVLWLTLWFTTRDGEVSRVGAKVVLEKLRGGGGGRGGGGSLRG